MLLTTKFHAAPPPAHLVPRPRLVQQLQAGTRQRFTLVSAPAGFGKTTLISAWLHNRAEPFAWLSLGVGDNDPVRFWTYVIGALQTVQPELGRDAQAMLQSPQPPPLEAVLTMLINDLVTHQPLDESGAPYCLVLDDYHLIETIAIHESVNFLLDRLPRSWHPVLVTRMDPPLSLPRRRARREVSEVRAKTLRFTEEETARFFEKTADRSLSPAEVATLAARTEGWVASLQLAGISLQAQPDPSTFIAAFAGNDRYVMDYLVDEVFARQPEDVQRFLLDTSILDSLCAGLCEAVVYGEDGLPEGGGQATLRYLEQANLFVVPLDNHRAWYRYHHLFADLLTHRLRQKEAPRIPALHRRAAQWYEQQGKVEQALHHVLEAEEMDWAARLIEQAGDAMIWAKGEMATLARWLDRLSEARVRSSPKLCLLRAWLLYADAQIESIAPFLSAAEASLQQADQAAPGLQAMQGEAAALRAFVATRIGDGHAALEAIESARRALEQLPDETPHLRALLTFALAEAYFSAGDLTAARPTYQQATTLGRSIGNRFLYGCSLLRLCDIYKFGGTLDQMGRALEDLEQLIAQYQDSFVAPFALGEKAEFLRERNDPDKAVALLREAIDTGQRFAQRWLEHDCAVYLAQALRAQEDFKAALEATQHAIRIRTQHRIYQDWSVIAPQAYQARLHLLQGEVAQAARWAEEAGLKPTDTPSHFRELEYLALVRVLIAQDRTEEATVLLEQIREQAEADSRVRNVIEVLVLHALALEQHGEPEAALQKIAEALALAEPSGYIRLFVDEDPSLMPLLYRAAEHGLSPDYARRLLAAFPHDGTASPTLARIIRTQATHLEPLTKREIEILRLIAEGLSNQQIADTLFLSLHTVKAHTRNIFGKLDVRRRTQAVSKAQGLGILTA